MKQLLFGLILVGSVSSSIVYAECPVLNGTFIAVADGHSTGSGNLGISSVKSNDVMTYTLRDQWAKDTRIIADGNQHLSQNLNALYSAICTKNSITITTDSPNSAMTIAILDLEGNISLTVQGNRLANYYYKVANQVDPSLIDRK